MSLCTDDADLILLNGPPFEGVLQYYNDHLSKTHTSLIPSEVFSQGQSLGLRDIGLKIVQQIQQGKKVAVLDGNEVRKTRESYIKLLKKKCSNSSFLVINIFPKYGCYQLFWSREQELATTDQSGTKLVSVTDKHILKWFEKETDMEISYRFGQVDAVIESEGCSVETVTCRLAAKSTYKWEVPGLFIQWEIINREMERVVDSIIDVIRNWISNNPCGRIIMICDGTKIKTGEESKYEEISKIKSATNTVCNQVDDSVVYVYHIEGPDQAGWFVQPPRPGILAYLQKRHNLNLHSRNTCYLYHTSDHMKMAENAGVRHIKGTKVLRNPNMINSQTAMTIPPIPAMLKSFEIVLEHKGSDLGPLIPMSDMKEQFKDGMIFNVVGRGRTEYVFAKEWNKVKEMQELYKKMASKVGQEGSNMSPEKINQSGGFVPLTSEMNQSKTSFVSRDLPDWMLGKAGSGSKSLKSSAEQSRGLELDDHSKKKTIYMMTDHELVETAIDILKQAGKTDVINSFISKQETTLSGTKGNYTKKHRSPSNKQINTSLHRKRLSDESLSSLCPKMEPDSEDENSEMKDDMCSNKMIKDQSSNSQTGYKRRERKGSAKRSCKTRKTNIELETDRINEFEDSDECPSTETSQGDGDSLDLESEIEDIGKFDEEANEGMVNNETNNMKEYSNFNDELFGIESSNIVRERGNPSGNPHEKLRVDARITSNIDSKLKAKHISVKVGKSRTNATLKRPHRPDLSILDEIFD